MDDEHLHQRGGKQARTAGDNDSGAIHVVLSNTIANLHTPPTGLNEEVLPIDRDTVARLMVLFSKAVEPEEPTRQWTVKAVISNADGPNTVQCYNCYFTGYKGVITVDELHKFQLAHQDEVSYVGIDLTFVSADQAYAGAIVLCIPSSPWKAKKAAESAKLAQKPITAAHIEDAKFIAATNDMQSPLVTIGEVTQVPAINTTNTLLTALPMIASVAPLPPPPPPPSKKRKGLFTGLLVQLAGLGDGEEEQE